MKYLSLLPFFIELVGDWFLIRNGKRDIPWWMRVIMILVIAVIISPAEPNLARSIVMSCMLYCFFDPALNIIRELPIDYIGETKAWDRWLRGWNRNFIIFVRITVFLFLIVLYHAV